MSTLFSALGRSVIIFFHLIAQVIGSGFSQFFAIFGNAFGNIFGRFALDLSSIRPEWLAPVVLVFLVLLGISLGFLVLIVFRGIDDAV